jgi:hypothetical protein
LAIRKGSYTVLSPGRDGNPDRGINLLAPEYKTISRYSEDVVFHNGTFYRWVGAVVLQSGVPRGGI